MTNLISRDPFSDMRETMDRLFDQGFSRPWHFLPASSQGGFPVDIWETDDSIELEASMPGVSMADVNISVAADTLSIQATAKADEGAARKYHLREIRRNAYNRSFRIPVSVDADRARARFEDGMLYLHLPKAEAVRPKQIQISAEGKVAGSA